MFFGEGSKNYHRQGDLATEFIKDKYRKEALDMLQKVVSRSPRSNLIATMMRDSVDSRMYIQKSIIEMRREVFEN